MKHQKGNSRRPALLDMKKKNGKTVFQRTDVGEFFHDVVFSKKTLKSLSQKWELPIAELRNLRKIGRSEWS